MARNAVPFSSSDPILGLDVSFYLFQLPFLQFVQNLALMIVVLAAIARCRRAFRRPEPHVGSGQGAVDRSRSAQAPERADCRAAC